MSTYQELADASVAVHQALSALDTKRAALEAKEPLVLAVLTTEQAAIDGATTAYNAARDIARESTGWAAARAELTAAEAAYTAAKETFETVASSLPPLDVLPTSG
jgi:hypothetical protein